MTFSPGDLCGDLVIRRRLGKGGMAEVFLAEAPASGAQYAVKVLAGALHAEDLLRFQREAEAQAAADAHPNVLRIHAWRSTPRGECLVMEYAPLGDLAARLRGGPLSPAEAAAVVRDLALGLEHVHRSGVLHRDLKPANVLFDQQGAPKLADFGLARVAGADSLTATGAVMGTPAYMAPEQVETKSRGAVDARVDVYGLGALLYHCLTGSPPFQGSSVYVVLRQVLERPPVAPSRLVPGIPRGLEAVCMRCLAKAPRDRFPSAAALAAALAPGVLEPQRRTRQHLGVAAGLAASGAMIFGAALWPTRTPGGALRRGDSPATVSPPPPGVDSSTGDRDSRGGSSRRESRALPVYAQPITSPLRFLPPDMLQSLRPAAGWELITKLNVWRAVHAKGSWLQLGRMLYSETRDRTLEKNDVWALLCFLEAWRLGGEEATRAMTYVGRCLLPRGEEGSGQAALGIDLIRQAAARRDREAAWLLSRIYTSKNRSLTLWDGLDDRFPQPNPKLESAYLFLAGEYGKRGSKPFDGRIKRLEYPLPPDAHQAWRWIAEEVPLDREQDADWASRPDAPLAEPTARERVAQLLQERTPISVASLRSMLVPELTDDEWGELEAQRRFLEDTSWRAFASDLDKEDTGLATRQAAACDLRAVTEDGDVRSLHRFPRLALELVAGAYQIEFGKRCAMWAAFAGDAASRWSLANSRVVEGDDVEGGAWVYLERAARRSAGAGVRAGISTRGEELPQSEAEAWEIVERALRERR